jgi:hypothetical protein
LTVTRDIEAHIDAAELRRIEADLEAPLAFVHTRGNLDGDAFDRHRRRFGRMRNRGGYRGDDERGTGGGRAERGRLQRRRRPALAAGLDRQRLATRRILRWRGMELAADFG